MSTLPTVWKGTVLPQWIDHNGHMNAGYYMVLFDEAGDPWLDHCGIDTAYRNAHRRSTFTAESHLTYRRELREGDPLRVESQLLGFAAKKIHSFHRLFHDREGYLAATCEVMSLHVDIAIRKTVPMPAEILERLEKIRARQATVPRPEAAGRRISV